MTTININLTVNGEEVSVDNGRTALAETDSGIADLSGVDLTAMDLGEPVESASDATAEAEAVWHTKRSGRLTCSRFGDLMSTGRKKDEDFSQTGLSYLRLKLAERLGSYETISGPALQWGTDNEAEALRQYALRNNVTVDSEPYRFFEYDDDIGGTPDALVGDDGCVEVKCPYNPATHIETRLSKSIPDRYRWQVVGHLLVTNRAWCDFVSFDPRIAGPKKIFVVRYERNGDDILQLKAKLQLAVEWLKAAEGNL